MFRACSLQTCFSRKVSQFLNLCLHPCFRNEFLTNAMGDGKPSWIFSNQHCLHEMPFLVCFGLGDLRSTLHFTIPSCIKRFPTRQASTNRTHPSFVLHVEKTEDAPFKERNDSSHLKCHKIKLISELGSSSQKSI